MAKFKYLENHTGYHIRSDGEIEQRTVDVGYDALTLSLPGRHGPFRTEHVLKSGGLVTGRIDKDSFIEWPSRIRNTLGVPWPSPDVGTPSVALLSTRLHAESNPSHPITDIGQAIGELKDIPKQLKEIGDSFLHKGFAHAFGHLNLSYKFGWAPFLRDVASLLKCQENVDRRFNELRKLKKNGTAIRKRQLSNLTKSESLLGENDYWKTIFETTRTEKVWGYTIWKPTDNFPTTDAELFQLARKYALGLSLRPETAWKLMPWSWLIDWFANVGTYVEAMRNTAELTCTVANICLEYTQEQTANSTGLIHEDTDGKISAVVSPMSFLVTRKNRFPADPPTLTAQLPMLTMDQLGILGSISATRR